MKKIREGVFETNSSSTHSISIASGKCKMIDTIFPDENGDIVLNGGQFGWEIREYNNAITKANYCAIDQFDNLDRIKMLSEVILEQTGAKRLILDFTNNYKDKNYSYIDHQSEGTSNEAFESKEILRNFIFNPESVLYTDNDNH